MKRGIISLQVDEISFIEVQQKIIAWAKCKLSKYVCVANVHMTIEAYWDADYSVAVNSADLIVADGMPIAKAMRLFYGVRQERIAGMDLLPVLLTEAEKEGLGIFFYGGTDDMLEQTRLYVNGRYPKIISHHCYSPPFRELSSDESDAVIEKINCSGAHLVFVILGCPKQEKWMFAMKERINACMIGVGGAVPVMIGQQSRAPLWMQKASLEWVYRLMQEPRRLFKRYFVTNTLFLLLVFKQCLFSSR